METNLVGRLRNTSLPKSHALLPLFEAVANSIHAIEDWNDEEFRGEITIEINRAPLSHQLPLASESARPGRDALREIEGFRVVDNGVGFTDENFKSFNVLDSSYKEDRGGRGVGRLLWLKAFDRVFVLSNFTNANGDLVTRKFYFSPQKGVEREQDRIKSESYGKGRNKTVIQLDGFKTQYKSVAPKSCKVIAQDLLQHCLWYFIRPGGAPKISVRDGDDVADLEDLYDEETVTSITPERIEVKGVEFELTHVKLRAPSSMSGRHHSIAFCAANRFVREEPLRGWMPGLTSSLEDSNGGFFYRCYVTADFLDRRVRAERTSFDIDEKSASLFGDTELSFEDIISKVVSSAKAILKPALDKKKQASRERIFNFVATKAPRYRPIIRRIPEEDIFVDPDISDKDLDLRLHQHFASFERAVLAEGHDIMAPAADEDAERYREKLETYLTNVDDLKKSDLAGYVSHRKVIIDLVSAALNVNSDGKYSREDRLHTLLMPMKTNSEDRNYSKANLWLLDERLAFHDFLASDLSLSSMDIASSTDLDRPDLCGLKVVDSPALAVEGGSPPFSSLTIVEIKRPMRDDANAGADKDPIEQCLKYLKKIRDGKVKTAMGRPLGDTSNSPAYCYIIADITSSMRDRCNIHDLSPTSDGLGFFGYKKSFKAYVEVLSFDRLVNAAVERNRAFFDKLSLPTF